MNTVIKRAWNKNKLVKVEDLTGMIFQAESGGHTFEISGVDDTGAAVSLSGTVEARFLRADNAEIIISGTVSSGKASVTLSAACYAIPGRFLLTVYVTSGGQKVAVYAATGSVVATSGTASGSIPPLVTDSIQTHTIDASGNVSVGGVLDVVPRRCYAALSSAGWYRVLTLSGNSNDRPLGSPSFVIDITIVRQFGGSNNELHKVSLLAVYNSIAFANETSKSNDAVVDKIRYTRNGKYGYIDIHFDTSTSNDVTVCFDVKTYPLFDYQFVATTPTAVASSPSGETVLATHNFVSNNSPVGVTNSSNLLTSGTIASSGSMSYTATVPCWVYLMFIMQANSRGLINVQIDNVNIINWSSGGAVPVNFSFLPIPLMPGNTLYVEQTSNEASTYSIFAMR